MLQRQNSALCPAALVKFEEWEHTDGLRGANGKPRTLQCTSIKFRRDVHISMGLSLIADESYAVTRSHFHIVTCYNFIGILLFTRPRVQNAASVNYQRLCCVTAGFKTTICTSWY